MSHTSAPASSGAGHQSSQEHLDGSLSVGDVVALVEAAASPGLAASWDSNGLICGDPADPVRSILLAVDPVVAVVDEAVDSGVDMIITHHPLYLRGTDHVAATDPKGRSIHRLIRAGIALLNAHTSLDVAPSLPDSAPGLLVGGDLDAVVERIAVSGGAGDSLLQRAREAGADVFLTADLRHHPASEHLEDGRPYLLCGTHWATEWVGLEPLARRLEEGARSHGASLTVRVSHIVTDPWVLRLSTGSDDA